MGVVMQCDQALGGRCAKIVSRGFAEGHSKCRYECAGAVVSDFQCNTRNRFASRQQSHRMSEAKLLPPFAESQTGFEFEKPLQGALAGAGKLRELDERSFIRRFFLKQRPALFRAPLSRP